MPTDDKMNIDERFKYLRVAPPVPVLAPKGA